MDLYWGNIDRKFQAYLGTVMLPALVYIGLASTQCMRPPESSFHMSSGRWRHYYLTAPGSHLFDKAASVSAVRAFPCRIVIPVLLSESRERVSALGTHQVKAVTVDSRIGRHSGLSTSRYQYNFQPGHSPTRRPQSWYRSPRTPWLCPHDSHSPD